MSTGRDAGPGVSTAHAISPDSGTHWSAEGAWPAAEGIHRIPLPLPNDGLRAVNVYVLEQDDGLTLVDGGWAIQEARDLLDAGLRSIGSGFGDIRRFLVTHSHRDHYTMARLLGTELGAEVLLGSGERPALAMLDDLAAQAGDPFGDLLRSAGAHDVAERWAAQPRTPPDPAQWAPPDTWIEEDGEILVGTRVLDAVATPGHTPGHLVFADLAAGLLLAGDHVLPTITPSIGFTVPPPELPLGAFLSSLAVVRAMPDLVVLPAHGPVGCSSHERVDELTAHHEERLVQCLDALGAGTGTGGGTAYDVARALGWTRHQRRFEDLDVFNQGMATMETKAHLDLLVARGDLAVVPSGSGDTFAAPSTPPS